MSRTESAAAAGLAAQPAASTGADPARKVIIFLEMPLPCLSPWHATSTGWPPRSSGPAAIRSPTVRSSRGCPVDSTSPLPGPPWRPSAAISSRRLSARCARGCSLSLGPVSGTLAPARMTSGANAAPDQLVQVSSMFPRAFFSLAVVVRFHFALTCV